MDAKQIRFFLEIVRTGSFTSAAKKLFISVPGLVKSMDKLEDELGAPLLSLIHIYDHADARKHAVDRNDEREADKDQRHDDQAQQAHAIQAGKEYFQE